MGSRGAPQARMPVFPQVGDVTQWSGMDPSFLAFFGTGFALGFSVLGAAWGIFLTGSSLVGAAIKVPRIKSKNLISVIFCESLAIYGVIIAIICATKIKSSDVIGDMYETQHGVSHWGLKLEAGPNVYFGGYCFFWTGLTVGLANLFCGFVSEWSGQHARCLMLRTPECLSKS